MNFLRIPKNLNYELQLFNKAGDLVQRIIGSEALTALSSIEKAVSVEYVTTVSSGDVSMVSDSIQPDVSFNEVKLIVRRDRSFILPYEPEVMEKVIFDGEVTLPYVRTISNRVSFPVRSFLISKNIEEDFNLGTASAKAHVITLLEMFDDVTVDTASFTALTDSTSINLFIEKDWFRTFNEIITGLCWLGRFAIRFEGKTAYAVTLTGIPEDPTLIKNTDILLDAFEVSTKAETEVVTRMMLTDPNNNRMSWYNNIEFFGDNPEEVKLPYYGLLTADVTNAVNFWLANKSKLWLRFQLKLPYSYLNLEPYSMVELEDVSQWVPNLNMVSVRRLDFNSLIPSFYTLTDNVRTVFKNGGFVYLKTVIRPGTDGEWRNIFNLGHGTGLWVDENGYLLYWNIYDTTELDPDYAGEGIWSSTTPSPYNELLNIVVAFDEEDLNTAPVITVNGVLLTLDDWYGPPQTVASLYETDGCALARSYFNDGLTINQREAFDGFIFDVLFYNQTEEIALFISADRGDEKGTFFGDQTPVTVDELQESGITNALGRVERVTVDLDGTLTALIESDIDGFSRNRDLTYWTGPGNSSGIIIIGQTVTGGGMATLLWKPITSGFTKYEVAVEKNGAPFYSDNDVTAISHDVQLTVAESHTYTWRVRGFTDSWQPWSFTSQFRWIPDAWTDGRITALEWANNVYEKPYGPEYCQGAPNQASFVVNAQFDRLQARASNLVEFSGPTTLPQKMTANVRAASDDLRFYVRGLDLSTEMWSDWYMGPEYSAHPGVPAAPSGWSETRPSPFYVNDTGPVFWRSNFTGYVVVTVPARACTVFISIRPYHQSGNRYIFGAPTIHTINAYPVTRIWGFEDIIRTGFSAYTYRVGEGFYPRFGGIEVVTWAANAAGSSEFNVFYSTLTADSASGPFSVSNSAIDGARVGREPSRVYVPGEQALPQSFFVPNLQPQLPPEEQDPEVLLDEAQVIGSLSFPLSLSAPAGTAFVVVPYQTAFATLVVFRYLQELIPDVLADGSMVTPVTKYVVVPAFSEIVVPGDNLANRLNTLGRARATLWGVNPIQGVPLSAPTAYYNGAQALEAGQTAYQLWFYDEQGNAIGERGDHDQNVNKQLNVVSADPDEGGPSDREAIETQAIHFDTSWEVVEFPCRPNTLEELMPQLYPPCGALCELFPIGYPDWGSMWVAAAMTENGYGPFCSGVASFEVDSPLAILDFNWWVWTPPAKTVKKVRVYYYRKIQLENHFGLTYCSVDPDASPIGFEMAFSELPLNTDFPGVSTGAPIAGKFLAPIIGLDNSAAMSTATGLDIRAFNGCPARVVVLLGNGVDDTEDEWFDLKGHIPNNLTNWNNIISNSGAKGTITIAGTTLQRTGVDTFSVYGNFQSNNYVADFSSFNVVRLDGDLTNAPLTVLSNPEKKWDKVVQWACDHLLPQPSLVWSGMYYTDISGLAETNSTFTATMKYKGRAEMAAIDHWEVNFFAKEDSSNPTWSMYSLSIHVFKEHLQVHLTVGGSNSAGPMRLYSSGNVDLTAIDEGESFEIKYDTNLWSPEVRLNNSIISLTLTNPARPEPLTEFLGTVENQSIAVYALEGLESRVTADLKVITNPFNIEAYRSLPVNDPNWVVDDGYRWAGNGVDWYVERYNPLTYWE